MFCETVVREVLLWGAAITLVFSALLLAPDPRRSPCWLSTDDGIRTELTREELLSVDGEGIRGHQDVGLFPPRVDCEVRAGRPGGGYTVLKKKTYSYVADAMAVGGLLLLGGGLGVLAIMQRRKSGSALK